VNQVREMVLFIPTMILDSSKVAVTHTLALPVYACKTKLALEVLFLSSMYYSFSTNFKFLKLYYSYAGERAN
jgi:hypothetical protein